MKPAAISNMVTLPNVLLFFNSFLLFIFIFRIESLFSSSFRSESSPPSDVTSDSSDISNKLTKIEFNRAEETYQANLNQRNLDKSLSIGKLGDKKTYYIRSVYPCPWEVRIGGWNDGGKWLCMLPSYKSKPLIIYSIGSNGQTEFEEEMWRLYKTKTFTFDPTLKIGAMAKVKALNYIEFHNIGLTAEDDFKAALKRLPHVAPGARVMKLDQIMKMLGHDFIDIFKIDCEGCEVGVMNRILSQSTRDRPLFGQILLEVHSLPFNQFDQFFLEFKLTEKLESLGYRLYRAEQVFYYEEYSELFYVHESLLNA